MKIRGATTPLLVDAENLAHPFPRCAVPVGICQQAQIRVSGLTTRPGHLGPRARLTQTEELYKQPATRHTVRNDGSGLS